MGYHFRTVSSSVAPFRLIDRALKAFGATGVDMFFVLSGFLVGGLLLNEYKQRGCVQIGRFLARRGLKIFPAYYFYLLFQIVSRHFPLRTFLWQNLLLVQNYSGSSISHSWTVSLEIHFYVVLAFAMGYLASRHASPRKLLCVFVLAGLSSFLLRVISIYLGHWQAAIFYTHNRLDSLLCGVLLATLATFFPKRFATLSDRKWPLILIMGMLTSYLIWIYPRTMEQPKPGWGYLGACVLYLGYAAVMLFMLRYTSGISSNVTYRLVGWVGTYSYGIYLWHNSVRQPCAALVSHLAPAAQWAALFCLQYTSAILLGAGMSILIEWPVLRYRDRLLPQRDLAIVDHMATSRH